MQKPVISGASSSLKSLRLVGLDGEALGDYCVKEFWDFYLSLEMLSIAWNGFEYPSSTFERFLLPLKNLTTIEFWNVLPEWNTEDLFLLLKDCESLRSVTISFADILSGREMENLLTLPQISRLCIKLYEYDDLSDLDSEEIQLSSSNLAMIKIVAPTPITLDLALFLAPPALILFALHCPTFQLTPCRPSIEELEQSLAGRRSLGVELWSNQRLRDDTRETLRRLGFEFGQMEISTFDYRPVALLHTPPSLLLLSRQLFMSFVQESLLRTAYPQEESANWPINKSVLEKYASHTEEELNGYCQQWL